MKKQAKKVEKLRSYNTKKRRPTSVDAQVGASIRAHRLMAKMSQEALAQRLGVTFQQVQKYEKGTNRVGAGRLPLIAETFNVPVGSLFTGSAVGAGGAVPADLVTDNASVRLLTAFAAITDTSIRRNLSELAERISKSAKKKPRGDRGR
jgi:transcriptional regulator with XRE-family HTH domain